MAEGGDNALADARHLEQAQSAPAMIGMIRQQLDQGFVRLRFEPRLEAIFRRENDAASRVNRIALLALAALVLLLSPFLDTAYFGVTEHAAWWSRLLLIGGLVPTVLATLLWCLFYGRCCATEAILTIQFAILRLGLLANHAILNRYNVDFPIEFVGIALVAVVALGRVRSWLILPIGAVLAALTLVTEIWIVDAKPGDYYHLAAAGVLALFAIYLQCASEYARRRSWLDRHLLQRVARHDGLTGLLNRHALESALASAQAHAVREGCGYGLAMIDIDQFGAYNNRYGHPGGDLALRQVAEVIEAHARRPLDVCGRYGGEEFVALWVEHDPARIIAHAETLRAAIQAQAIEHAASRVAPVVTVSIGLCLVDTPAAHDSLNGVLTTADQLLYAAKAGGRNRVNSGTFERPACAPVPPDAARGGRAKLMPASFKRAPRP